MTNRGVFINPTLTLMMMIGAAVGSDADAGACGGGGRNVVNGVIVVIFMLMFVMVVMRWC